MNIHEYQAKELLARYGIPAPRGGLARTPADARAVAEELGGDIWMVKAQVHAGGRGKAGGVWKCASLDEVEAAAGRTLGMRLTTRQTGPEGILTRKVWVEQAITAARELYLAVVLDRAQQRLTVIASPDGGVDIEPLTERNPERVFTERLDGGHVLWPFQARRLLLGCGLTPAQLTEGAELACGLARLAVEKDAVLAEINPLAITREGKFSALDAKMRFDWNAVKRHPDIAALEEAEDCDALELKARSMGINYVRLSGHVGVMVNGAGLAMAAMDAIQRAGAEPANFLDIGGGADEKKVAAGLEVMLSDPNVRGILINIFGGLLRCDVAAQGVVDAVRRMNPQLPLVVRFEGANVEKGRCILRESDLAFETACSLSDAAQKIAAATRAGGAA